MELIVQFRKWKGCRKNSIFGGRLRDRLNLVERKVRRVDSVEAIDCVIPMLWDRAENNAAGTVAGRLKGTGLGIDHVLFGKKSVWSQRPVATTHACMVLDFEVHQLSSNATAMRSLADSRQNWTNSIQELRTSIGICKIDSRLDNIIRERIPEHALKLGRSNHFLDQETTSRSVRSADALFDDVGAELLL